MFYPSAVGHEQPIGSSSMGPDGLKLQEHRSAIEGSNA
jgi:hypothetical protein